MMLPVDAASKSDVHLISAGPEDVVPPGTYDIGQPGSGGLVPHGSEDIGPHGSGDLELPAAEEPATRPSFWSSVGDGLTTLGVAVSRAAVGFGGTVAQAYNALDPDLRRHLVQLPLMGLTYLSPAPPPLETLPNDGRRMVVFVHGLGGHRGNFLAMQSYFRWMGRRRALSVGFRDQDSILTMADQLRALLTDLIDANKLPESDAFDLVTHSMGGIIARLALEEDSVAQKVAHLVTLGTPHSGTQLARLLQTSKVRDLRPGSDLLERLQNQLPWSGPPRRPRLTAVWSPADLVLMPPEAATVEGAHNVRLEGFSHFSYLVNPESWKRVYTLLEPSVLTQAGPKTNMLNED